MHKYNVESRKEWATPELKKVAIEEITSKLTTSNDGVGHANS